MKGHAQSEGNYCADAAAREVVQIQTGNKEEPRLLWKEEVSGYVVGMSTDPVEEWFWRVNRERLLRGEDGLVVMDISDDASDNSA